MQLSVILSAHNAFDYQRLYYAIQQLLAQEGVEMEIVAAESNTEPHFAPHPKKLGILYAFEVLSGIAKPGRIRNLALALPTGNSIYSTDADIKAVWTSDLVQRHLSQSNTHKYYHFRNACTRITTVFRNDV